MYKQKLFALLILWILALTPCLALGKWQRFSPPVADFIIMMPAGVDETTSYDKNDTKFLDYRSSEGEGFYKISQGIPINKELPKEDIYKPILERFEKSAKKNHDKFTVNQPVPVSGKGWTGERVDSNYEDVNFTFIKAISNNKDVFYDLDFSGHEGTKINEDFVKSFEVYPDIASKAHSELLTPDRGRIVGKWVNQGLVILFIIAFVTMRMWVRSGIAALFRMMTGKH